MQRNTLRASFLFVALLSLSACNVFHSFASPGNDEAYIEEARACLHSQNYACAVENYSKVTNEALKNEKLCIVSIARSGINLTALVSIITGQNVGAELPGQLAEAMLPFTEEKLAAASESPTYCNALPTATAEEAQTAGLLQSLAYLSQCAIRLARTDTLVSVSANASQTDCNSTTAGNGDGRITDSDISFDGTGVLGPGVPGICDADIFICQQAIANAGSLAGSSGSADLIENINALPAAFQGPIISAARAEMLAMIPAD